MKNRYERAELLRKAREAKGYTQRELADLLNYSNKTLSKWETGESYPTDYGTLQKYAKLLDLDINEIVDGRNIENKYKINIGNIVIDIRNIMKIVITILFTIFIMLLVFYIIYSSFEKGKIRVYDLKIDSDIISLSNHTLFVSNNINILDFAKIEDGNNINELILYYKERGKIVEIFRGSNIGFKIKDKKSDNENHLNNIENKDVYLVIKYKDGTKNKYKVSFVEEYVNSKIYTIDNSISNYDELFTCERLSNYGFKDNEGLCLKEEDDRKIIFNENSKMFMYYINKDSLIIVIEKKINKKDYVIKIIDKDGNTNFETLELIDLFNSNNIIFNYVKDLYDYEKKLFSL